MMRKISYMCPCAKELLHRAKVVLSPAGTQKKQQNNLRLNDTVVRGDFKFQVRSKPCEIDHHQAAQQFKPRPPPAALPVSVFRGRQ